MLPDKGVELARSQRWRRAAFSAFVALASAVACILILSQVTIGGASVALFGAAGVAVFLAWNAVGPLFGARLVALAQGIVWFLLLIHGGLGLFFGPLGWLASAIAGRVPRVAAAILAVPAAFLTVSWAPAFFGGLELREGLILLALIPPALFAAAVLVVRTPRHEDESIT